MVDQIQYFIRDGAGEKGPFSLGQMRSLWSQCQVNLATEYRTDGLDVWCPLADIAELLEPPAAPPRSASYPGPAAVVELRKSRGIYIILGLFFGAMGVHNFYAGRYPRAASQLLITLLLGWIYVGLAITILWSIADVLLLSRDGRGRPLA